MRDEEGEGIDPGPGEEVAAQRLDQADEHPAGEGAIHIA